MNAEPKMTTRYQKNLIDLFSRVQKLEQVVFGNSKQSFSPKDRLFKGATGGLRLLISKGFFDERKKFADIKESMSKHGYHYSNQAIQTPLNNLSKASGPLVGFKIKGKKVYAKRK